MGKWQRLSLLSFGAGYDRCVPIYHAVAKGRTVPLLKTLVSSHCTNNCAYCAFRCDRRIHREQFEPAELASIAMELWRRGIIEGVFLSSSVVKDPDTATLAEIQTSELLRRQGYTGYLHLRLMPGCSRDLVQRAVQLADRVGINVENPDPGALAEIRVGIDLKLDVWRRMEWCREEAEKYRRSVGPGFARAGLDTQFVVGAADEKDAQIIDMSYRLYTELGLRRVYYSGFRPISRTPLEDREPCPSYREYRLYQVSFLIRDYGFKPSDFEPALDDRGFLRDVDPKLILARTHPELFPIDLNTASMKELLLAPGIGPRTARRILDLRARAPFRSLSHAQKLIGFPARAASPYLSVGRERQERLEKFSRPTSLLHV